ncbi:unnamed protein product [Adineta steineri]|uniref:Glycosyltransferase 2-like domain-containing protein n=1 Tax=Adineta steineri TaxID=433720 RepID=A0A814I463_9BILA|nr:unnamed protein product [Adineta steineri]CAF4122621.1 unnamed protein product [Adineta steineri]
MLMYIPFWTIVKKREHLQWTMENEAIKETYPIVDVFIVCCNEPYDILLDTVRSALSLNYPKDKYRIWILDDGNDKSIEENMIKISKTYETLLHVKYIRRLKQKNTPHYYKAGNLNNGIREVKQIIGQVGDYVLVQDVDMILHPDFLLRTLPHFKEDDRVAFVQAGQNYYNLYSSDILCQGLIGINQVLLHCDSNNQSSICIGSGVLIKSSIIDELNGFPTDSITEDFHFSFSIHKLGYKSVYITEHLQFGLIPDSLIGTIEQYKRWESGNFQVICRYFDKLFSCKRYKNRMTFFQRINYFIHGTRIINCLMQLYSMLLLLVSLWIEKPYVILANSSILKMTLTMTWIQYLFSRFILYFIHYDMVIDYNSSGYDSIEVTDVNETKTQKINSILCILQFVERTMQKSAWTSPFYFVSLSEIFVKIPLPFIPTGSYPSIHDERKNFLKFILNLISKGLIFHILYIPIGLAAIIYQLIRMTSKTFPLSLWYIPLVVINIYSLIPPIWFIIFPPPPTRNRQDLLQYTEQEGNQEPQVKLKTNVSLYPTSKYALLLIMFPLLIIALVFTNIILLFISPDYIQPFLVKTNIPVT